MIHFFFFKFSVVGLGAMTWSIGWDVYGSGNVLKVNPYDYDSGSNSTSTFYLL